jgi:dTDP-4-amino-4,6-dideoxygalactose transaminase
LQAAILGVKLRYLDHWTGLRQRNAERYRSLFDECGLGATLKVPSHFADRVHVYNQYVVTVPRRDELRGYLRQHGIPTEVYYPHPLHLEPAFAYLGYAAGEFPNSEEICKQVLALPIGPKITEDQQRWVVGAVKRFFAEK